MPFWMELWDLTRDVYDKPDRLAREGLNPELPRLAPLVVAGAARDALAADDVNTGEGADFFLGEVLRMSPPPPKDPAQLDAPSWKAARRLALWQVFESPRWREIEGADLIGYLRRAIGNEAGRIRERCERQDRSVKHAENIGSDHQGAEAVSCLAVRGGDGVHRLQDFHVPDPEAELQDADERRRRHDCLVLIMAILDRLESKGLPAGQAAFAQALRGRRSPAEVVKARLATWHDYQALIAKVRRRLGPKRSVA